MAKQLIIDGDQFIDSTDWETKSKNIIEKLDKELFDNIYDDDLYDYKYDKDGNLTSKKKRRLTKGEVKPAISPAQVTAKLNRFLRIYRPMTSSEAKMLSDQDYLEAYGYYLDIISHINEFVTFLGDKQSFSAFCNINTTIYNELLTDAHYSQVFSSIEDGFVQSNFAVAEAGLVDSKTTIAKLQTKYAGHNLVKNPESINFYQTNTINTSSIDDMYAKYIGIAQKPKQITKGEK